MDVEELMRWLADTERRLQERGVQIACFQSEVASMDPDIRLTLESGTVLADINIWTALREAELHALSVETGEDLWLDRVSLADHDFHRLFSPILALF